MTASSSMVKLGSGKPALNIFFTPRSAKPVCNSSCKGCYLFQNYEPKAEALGASEVPEIINKMKGMGFEVFHPITTELLLAPNWQEILKATGDVHINTNGKIIAKKGAKVLNELAEAGINQIVITANLGGSHAALNLTEKEEVDSAFGEIRKFNEANPHSAFKTVATVIITTENFDKVGEICKYVHGVYGASAVKFIALIPFIDEISDLSPSLEQLRTTVNMIEAARGKYPKGEFYVQRGGTLGTQNLTPEKAAKLCPAGTEIKGVKSLKDGSPVTPCIYLPDFEIGKVIDGKIELHGGYDEFLEFKGKALAAGYCPAHANKVCSE